MEFTAKQIAEFVQGRVEGNENAAVHTFAKIEEGVPGAISFLSNPKYTHYLYETQSSIVLINEDVELEKPVNATLIRVTTRWPRFLPRQPSARTCILVLLPSSVMGQSLAMARRFIPTQ